MPKPPSAFSAVSTRRAFLATAAAAWTLGSLGCRSGERQAHAAEVEPIATPRLTLPDRPRDAETGSAFLARTAQLAPADFERAIYEAIASGNVPPFERTLATIELQGAGASGAAHVARLAVTPDYLAIGSDEDFARVPMVPETAQRVATLCGASLPTAKIVDAIYKQAEVKLAPRALMLDPNAINDRAAILVHQKVVEEARQKAGGRLGALTAGDKKDIVITNQLAERPDRVAIYGWQKEGGEPIQRLSTVHDRHYADYSHGVRLIAEVCEVDGKSTTVEAVLRDAELAALASDEGPLRITTY
jgi:hypothetical protein